MKKKLAQIDPVLLSRILFVSVIAVALFFAGTTFYFYGKLQKLHPSASVLSEKIKKNPLTLIETLGQFMQLPQEDPVIATVTSPLELQKKDFFKKAQAGDKVIVFPNAKLAILYRPSIEKIINVGPAQYQNTDALTEESTPSATPSGEAVQQVNPPVQGTVKTMHIVPEVVSPAPSTNPSPAAAGPSMLPLQ